MASPARRPVPGRGEAWGGGSPSCPRRTKPHQELTGCPLDEDRKEAEPSAPDSRMPVGRELHVHFLVRVSQSLALVEDRLWGHASASRLDRNGCWERRSPWLGREESRH